MMSFLGGVFVLWLVMFLALLVRDAVRMEVWAFWDYVFWPRVIWRIWNWR
jgi:hypothetical protein